MTRNLSLSLHSTCPTSAFRCVCVVLSSSVVLCCVVLFFLSLSRNPIFKHILLHFQFLSSQLTTTITNASSLINNNLGFLSKIRSFFLPGFWGLNSISRIHGFQLEDDPSARTDPWWNSWHLPCPRVCIFIILNFKFSAFFLSSFYSFSSSMFAQINSKINNFWCVIVCKRSWFLLTLEDYPLKSNFRQLLSFFCFFLKSYQLLSKFRFDVVIVDNLGALWYINQQIWLLSYKSSVVQQHEGLSLVPLDIHVHGMMSCCVVTTRLTYCKCR